MPFQSLYLLVRAFYHRGRLVGHANAAVEEGSCARSEMHDMIGEWNGIVFSRDNVPRVSFSLKDTYPSHTASTRSLLDSTKRYLRRLV